MSYLKCASAGTERRYGLSTARLAHRSVLDAECLHRLNGEAEARWSHEDGGPDPETCTCCGAPERSGRCSGDLCSVCHVGRASLFGTGHLVRLALDLGASLAQDAAGAKPMGDTIVENGTPRKLAGAAHEYAGQ